MPIRSHRPSFRHWFFLALAGVIGLALLAELGLRWAGVIDFPIYDVDADIGYIPAPRQQGTFLNKNRWAVNERSMGNESWQPHANRDVLLLGDSIVWGGNPLDQPDKLAARLQAAMSESWRVWSAAAGSWSVRNALAYLERYPDVRNETDVLVWVLNTGDLAATASQWHSDHTHPREHPASALLYVLQKYVAPRMSPPASDGSAPSSLVISYETSDLLRTRLQQLSIDKRILIVLYPDRSELKSPTSHYLAFREALQQAMGNCCGWLEIREQPEWHDGLYRDGIHPSAQGNRVLASLIARVLQ